MKQVNPDVIVKLKYALAKIYWYKNDLKTFILSAIENGAILSTMNWDGLLKRDLCEELISRMVNRPDLYQGDLLSLIKSVSNFSDYSHLLRLEDGKKKAQEAKQAVDELVALSHRHIENSDEHMRAEKQRVEISERMSLQATRKRSLEELYSRFSLVAMEKSSQKKGYLLERLLYDLFCYFDLDPKQSFRNTNEQIDGAFSFDGIDYLLEAKYVDPNSISKSDLLSFAGKVDGKLDNTLGVFISYNGFSQTCRDLGTDGVLKRVFLVDGSDLMAVLDGRITLNEMLLRKRHYAAQYGKIYLSILSLFLNHNN